MFEKKLYRFGIISFFLLYVAHVYSYRFLNDDAYISFRYAAHWVDYGEITYNLGERVEGYTNFLWVALLALGKFLGADIPQLSLILSAGLGLFNLSFVAYKASQLESDESLKKRRLLIAMALLSLSPSFCCWTSGGLEVQLFTTLFTVGFILSLKVWGALPNLSKAKPVNQPAVSLLPYTLFYASMAGFTFALAAMARPEGLLLFTTLGLYRIAHQIIQKMSLNRLDYVALFSFLACYLPYFLWRYQYYGYLFPNTYYAKVGAQGFWIPGLRYFSEWLVVQPWLIISLFMGGFSYFSQWRKQKISKETISIWNSPHIAYLLCTLALSFHVIRVGGDFMALHRFLVPLLPIAALLASGHFVCLWAPNTNIASEVRVKTKRVLFQGFLLCLLPLAFIVHQDANRIGSRQGIDSIGWLRQFAEQCAETGRFIQQHSEPKITLATTAAGALPYYAQRYTLDLLGLNDEWIAHQVPARGHRPGHTKSAPFRYPIDKKIDVLVYHPTYSDHIPRPSERMKRALSPLGYRWRSYQVPHLNPNWWSVWIKDGKDLQPLNSTIKKE